LERLWRGPGEALERLWRGIGPGIAQTMPRYSCVTVAGYKFPSPILKGIIPECIAISLSNSVIVV